MLPGSKWEKSRHMKTLLQHGLIYDGTGAEAFAGDILIKDDKILAFGQDLACEDASVVDLSGKSVSSGFFDAHSHNDWFAAKKDPRPYFEPFVRQGITSFITGNCGLSMTGFAASSPYIDKVGAGLFHLDDLTGVYPDVNALFAAIDGNTPLNIASLTLATAPRARAKRAIANGPLERRRAGAHAHASGRKPQAGRLRRFAGTHVRTRPLRAERGAAEGRRALRALSTAR